MVDAVLTEEEHAELLDVSFEAIEPDGRGSSGSWRIRLTTTGRREGSELLRGHVRAVFDDPQHPETLVSYVVHPAG